MKTGERIEELRKMRGISRPQLAAALGITPSSLWRWEHGDRAIREDRLREIAFLLKVPVAELLGDVAIIQAERNDSGMDHAVYQDWYSLHVYRNVADLQLKSSGTAPKEVIALPSFFVGQISEAPQKKPFIVVVDGDSMKEANISEGAFAVINPAEEALDGDAVLVRIGLRYTIRWIYWNKNGSGELRPSSAKYPVKSFDQLHSANSQFELLGKVMWSFAKPKSGL